ncbi:MAG TPA: S26 family signal peptidase [Streptosporangiaceae bacterium]|jgi:signal peptidase I
MKARRVVVTGTVAALAAGCLTLAWARRKLILITVRGDSMAPTYRNGQRLLVRRGGYQAGQVVVFRPSSRVYDVDWLVKRAVAVAGDPVPADLSEQAAVAVVPAGRLLVRSDAPDGLDSRQLGLIDDRDVLGVVRYPRARPAPV